MLRLNNDKLVVEINTLGAELQSIYSKETKLDYLWNADPQIWAKHSPVLFPIIGELKNGSYTYRGTTYQMSRHGFAREKQFAVTEHTDTSITLTLTDSKETRAVYPFAFSFSIQYTLSDNRLYVIYTVKNKSDEYLYFSVGGHPAFKVPLINDASFEDYYLSFSQVENAERYPLSSGGLIETTPVPFFENAERLPLKRELFYQDALVFKDIQSKSLTLQSDRSPHGLIFYCEGFPYLGIWNKKEADFLCIEPWCGIADSITADGDITVKEGINVLKQNETFERQWSVELF